MSAHYLINIADNPVATATIQDVRYPTNGQSTINGHFVVRVPDGVAVKNPVDVSDLITKKYQGLLAAFAGFANVTYDDLLDVSGLDLAALGTLGTFGLRNQVALQPGGSLQTVVTPLASSPTQAILTWELYEVTDLDPSASYLTRTYKELAASPSFATVQVSFDGGVTFLTATDSIVLNIPLISQGNQMIVRVTNAHATKRVRVGSWAAIY
jgi:hypothetical protein